MATNSAVNPDRVGTEEKPETPAEEIPAVETPETEIPEKKPPIPRGSAATEQQLRDAEFMKRLNSVMTPEMVAGLVKGVLTPETVAEMVATSPFATATAESLSAMGKELEKQAQGSADIHRDLQETSANVQQLLQAVNYIKAQAMAGAGGEGGTPEETFQFAQGAPVPNAELKYWTDKLMQMIGMGKETAEAAPAKPETQQVMETMKAMAESFTDIFGTVAKVINEVRRFDDSVEKRPVRTVAAEAAE